MLWGDRLILDDLRVFDETLITILHKDKVYLSPGVPTIERDEAGIAFTKYGVHYGEAMRFRVLRDTLTICVTRPVTESAMTAVPVFRRANVPIKVTSDYDDIFRRYLCCLLTKQAPELNLGLIGAASLRSIRREEMIESLLSESRSSKRATLTIESRNHSETIIRTPLVVLGLPPRTALKPRPMSLDLRQYHLVSCTAQKSTFLRFSASTNSHDGPSTYAQSGSHVSPAYVTELSD
ncbi:unnamed protein product [Heligmosomoides polygyrus]|uniref:Uncharacterized protein n=1 Tax=Heligmosomoides polygyrus TaxID=6339 RepID=A0A183FMM9_HELPZ|nr:unnamed protein product [Heligmosomoides polygyrus]